LGVKNLNFIGEFENRSRENSQNLPPVSKVGLKPCHLGVSVSAFPLLSAVLSAVGLAQAEAFLPAISSAAALAKVEVSTTAGAKEDSRFPLFRNMSKSGAWHKSIRPVGPAIRSAPAIPPSFARGYNHVNR